MITGAAAGLVLLAAMVGGLGLLLHSEASALRAGRVPQYVLAVAARLARRAPPASAAGSLSGFRDRAGALLAARGWRITAATVASHLMLWLVLLACLRAVSLSQAQLPWQTSLAAFALENGQGTLGLATIALVAPACARDCDSGCSGPRRHLTIQVGQVVRHDKSYPPAETNAACSGGLDAP